MVSNFPVRGHHKHPSALSFHTEILFILSGIAYLPPLTRHPPPQPQVVETECFQFIVYKRSASFQAVDFMLYKYLI